MLKFLKILSIFFFLIFDGDSTLIIHGSFRSGFVYYAKKFILHLLLHPFVDWGIIILVYKIIYYWLSVWGII